MKIKSTFIALFAAIICVGCFISIPLPGGVPITVQNLFAILSGLVLGSFYGAASCAIFILLGLIGVPVFSGCHGGPAVLLGPTGGYIIAYFISALVAGLIAGKPRISEKKFKFTNALRLFVASAVAFVLIYVPGVPWFMHVMSAKGNDVSFSKALSLTVIPFIAGDVIKLVISVPLALVLRPVAARYLQNE